MSAGAQFVPPPVSSWEGLSKQAGGFSPPPIESWEGPSPQKPGALEQIGTSIRNAAVGTAKLGLAASPVGNLPIYNPSDPNAMSSSPMGEMLKGAWEGQAEQGRKAAEEYHKGNYGRAALRGVAAAVPLVGPFVAQEVEKAPERPWETATDVALALGGPKLAGTATRMAGSIAERSATRAAGESIGTMIRGVKPRSALVEFRQHLERAMPEMKAAETDLGRPIGGVRDAIDAADAGMEKNWGQFEQYLKKASEMGAQVDGSAIADARIASIPSKLKLENPGTYRQLVDTANNYRRPLSVQEAQQLLAETNAAVKSYYLKFPGERYAERVSDPNTAADVATGDTLRDILYDKLDQISGSQGVPAQLKARYGSLKQVKGELMRRQNVADRQQPQSLVQQGGNMIAAEQGVNALGKLLTGQWGTAALDTGKAVAAKGVASAIREAATSDALIRNAFKNYQPTPFGSLTGSNLGELPPPAPNQPKGLLESGPIRMPTPDTSGSVPQVPNQNIPGPHTRVQRLLGAGPQPPRGNPQRPMNSVVSSEPVTPQALISMDDVVAFAHQNKMPMADAMKQLAKMAYRVNSGVMPPPTAQPRQIMPPPGQ